jgi:hypothetical protein
VAVVFRVPVVVLAALEISGDLPKKEWVAMAATAALEVSLPVTLASMAKTVAMVAMALQAA